MLSMRTTRVVVPPGVEPGDLFQIQTPSGDMLQVTCPPRASAGQHIHVPVVIPARAGSEAAPPVPAQMERVPPPPHAHAHAHADVRPSLKAAVRSVQTAQHLERKLYLIREGKHAPPPAEMPPTEMPPTPPPPVPVPPPVPAQMERVQASEPGLYSVANMTGTWVATQGDCCCCTCYECACYDCYECTGHKLWVRTPQVSTGLGTSFSTSSLDSMCNRDAHGHVPTFCVDDAKPYTQDNGEPRIYERTAGTNTFRCGEHTAILLGPRKMTVDGTVYHWGKWARQEFSDYSSGAVV